MTGTQNVRFTDRFKVGDKLLNGATLLAVEPDREGRRWVVLAQYGRDYVTWRCCGEGHCYWGEYARDIVTAAAGFQRRVHGRGI